MTSSYSTSPPSSLTSLSLESMKISSPKLNNDRNRNIISHDLKAGNRSVSPPPPSATTPGGATANKWGCLGKKKIMRYINYI
jgi:hypothetical protein